MIDLGEASRRSYLKGLASVAAAATIAPLAAKAGAAQADDAVFEGRIPVAFMVNDNANMMDLAGAWEVFQDARIDGKKGFYLYTVGPERRTFQTTGNGGTGLSFVPSYTFDDAPQPKVISMGAQGGDRDVQAAWIRKMEPRAEIVMSVCTGAFILAHSGLLDGKNATTHHDFFDKFEAQFPKVNLLRTSRFVDNGKFVSAGGLTSGIDGALHVVSRLGGMEAAEATARYMEYEGTGWKTGQRA